MENLNNIGEIEIGTFGVDINSILEVREGGEYAYKSIYLDPKFNWEIKVDDLGVTCLIPTKKK